MNKQESKILSVRESKELNIKRVKRAKGGKVKDDLGGGVSLPLLERALRRANSSLNS